MAAEPATADVKCAIAESHSCPPLPDGFPLESGFGQAHEKLHGEERAEKRRTRPVSSRRTSSRSRLVSQSQAQNPEDAGTDKNLGKHSCADCGERFPTPKTLKKHRDTHQEGQCHPCKKCSKTFRDLELLKRHRLVHRETEAASKDVGLLILEASRWRRKHRCAECGKHFLYAANLKKHRLQQHRASRPTPVAKSPLFHRPVTSEDAPENPQRDSRRVLLPGLRKVFKTAKHLKRHRLVHWKTPSFSVC
ncbi:hypothetical protein HHUSO_G33319 [Huso huso]|uniref:C2H2-type domain-containing protein n=1 Tax=Huso huso TaxID=61971 RepID=A0ABR0Y828_HUSHU